MKNHKPFSPYTLRKVYLFLIISLLSSASIYRPAGAQTIRPMVVSKLGKTYTIPPTVKIFQRNADRDGTTSIRNIGQEYLEWKQEGYFMRNRDLGQVFITTNPINLESIVLRTGPTEKAVLSSTPGAKVFLQFFEVTGTPVINNNGTPVGTSATHGYTTNHRGDDFIEGVTYTSLTDRYEGTFPNIPPTYDNVQQTVLGNEGKLHYMRWKFDRPIKFEGSKRYAFIIGFSTPAEGLGFTVANINSAGSSAAPSLTDNAAYYKGGWGIRREGDGTLPPTMYPGTNPPTNSLIRAQLVTEALFAPDSSRYSLQPTSDGYPDVDTYRAFEFYMEESPIPEQNLILNGEFDNGTSNWTVYNYPGARGEIQIETTQNMSGINAGKLSIPSDGAGTADWQIQLFQPISIEQGKQYNISFRGKAIKSRALKVAIQADGQTGNESIYWSNFANLTTSDQTFTYSFTANTTNTKARFTFHCGGNHVDPILDKIAVKITPPATVSASASSSENNINTPEKTRDNSLDTRWSSFGIGQWIQYDLGTTKTVNGIELAWFKGNERLSHFEVLVSGNGSTWTSVLNRSSSGTSLGLELYTFTSVTARYVRVVCKGTSVGNWNSITEAKIRIAGTSQSPSVSLRKNLESTFTVNPYQSELVIFPNPLKGELHLDLEAEHDSKVKVSVLTISGTLLLTNDHILHAGKNKLNIDLTEFAEGLYILSVDLKNKTLRRQFFLNK